MTPQSLLCSLGELSGDVLTEPFIRLVDLDLNPADFRIHDGFELDLDLINSA